MCFKNNNGTITTDIKYFRCVRYMMKQRPSYMNECKTPLYRHEIRSTDTRRFDSIYMCVRAHALIQRCNTSYLPRVSPLNSAISLTFLDYQTHHLQKCRNEMRSCSAAIQRSTCMSNISYHSGTMHVKLPHIPHYEFSMMNCWQRILLLHLRYSIAFDFQR